MSSAPARWYVAQTKPKAERRVSQWLETKGIEAFIPKMEIKRKRRNRAVTLIEPVFPGYVFVRIEPRPNSWNKLKWTPGIKTILGYDGVPSPIPGEVIEGLRERTGAESFIQPNPKFNKGEKVRIVDGPLRGLMGVIEEARPGKERVRILMEILRMPTRVLARVYELEKVPDSEHSMSFGA